MKKFVGSKRMVMGSPILAVLLLSLLGNSARAAWRDIGSDIVHEVKGFFEEVFDKMPATSRGTAVGSLLGGAISLPTLASGAVGGKRGELQIILNDVENYRAMGLVSDSLEHYVTLMREGSEKLDKLSDDELIGFLGMEAYEAYYAETDNKAATLFKN